ncbi:unnamed protein product [Fraxinus pennsylvanica]|uniref:Uncharacterized protein n=1 Tax=Fraxinus pennsylvanica TaxID=56036 RepID=A0AAD1ZH44_9LAMI|nr:unnamed protein product [Fraxinus pennsylvanica]
MSNARKNSTHEDDEVQQLLRAAQDDLLLKLSVDSHMARASSSSRTSMDPDLERRFESLKSKPKNTSTAAVSTITAIDDDKDQVKVNITNNIGGFEEDDLFARFTALKNSIPSHNRKNDIDSSEVVSSQQEEENDDEEDEVEKNGWWKKGQKEMISASTRLHAQVYLRHSLLEQ